MTITAIDVDRDDPGTVGSDDPYQAFRSDAGAGGR